MKLEPGEEPVASWVALIPFKRFEGAKEGGTLILTDRRLLMTSLTVPMVIGDLITISKAFVMWSAPLAEIRSVEPFDGKRSAQIQIETADGESRRFMIQHRRKATIMSKENVPVRDEAVKQIRAAARI